MKTNSSRDNVSNATALFENGGLTSIERGKLTTAWRLHHRQDTFFQH